jgi:hypothetical protein
LKPCGTCEDKRQKTKDKSAEKKSLIFIALIIKISENRYRASYVVSPVPINIKGKLEQKEKHVKYF